MNFLTLQFLLFGECRSQWTNQSPPNATNPTNQKPLPLYAIVFPKLFLFFDRFWARRTEEGKRNFHFVYNPFLEIVIDFCGKIGSFIIFLENIFLPLRLIKNNFCHKIKFRLILTIYRIVLSEKTNESNF